MLNLIKKFFTWDGITRGNQAGFIQAALTAAPYILNALGGVFGSKKRYIDPEELRQKYGPAAIARDTQSLSNYILNSPYGQQLLSQAAQSGQQMQTDVAARSAEAGLSPDTGGASGSSVFAAAAAPQAQASLERGVKANVWQAALPIAAGQNNDYANLELQNNAERNAEPSTFQKIAAAAGQAGGGLGSLFQKKVKKPGEQEVQH